MRRAISLAVLGAAPVHAQANSNVQSWATLTSDVQIAPNTQITADFITRSDPDRVNVGQLIVRGGLRQSLDAATSLTVNAGWFHNLRGNTPGSTEWRIGQYLTHRLIVRAPWTLDARLGVEERLVEGQAGLGVRTRERLRLTRRLSSLFEAQISQETIFALNSTGWGQHSGFVASRIGGQLRIAVAPHVGIAPGYMWQLVGRRGAPERNDHIVQVTIVAHF